VIESANAPGAKIESAANATIEEYRFMGIGSFQPPVPFYAIWVPRLSDPLSIAFVGLRKHLPKTLEEESQIVKPGPPRMPGLSIIATNQTVRIRGSSIWLGFFLDHSPCFGRLFWHLLVPPRLESVAQNRDRGPSIVASNNHSRDGEPDWERLVAASRPIDREHHNRVPRVAQPGSEKYARAADIDDAARGVQSGSLPLAREPIAEVHLDREALANATLLTESPHWPLLPKDPDTSNLPSNRMALLPPR